jgi:streptomycin 6-kinase
VRLTIPARLAAACGRDPAHAAWLEALPFRVRDLAERWALTLAEPFDGEEVSAAWVAPVTRTGGDPAVLKVGLPHFESEHEGDALRVWNGDGAVRLVDADTAAGALLIERCTPGTHLRALPEDRQDLVIAGLLRRLWRRPAPTDPFRPLWMLTEAWSHETRAQAARWPDAGLVRAGLELLTSLAANASDPVVLATDLHAGNVLRAEREPWLVIDPKPFAGDPAYDATQHLLNCRTRLAADPSGLIGRFAGLLAVDTDRVRLWTFARLAADPRDDWRDGAFELAVRLRV